MENTLKVLKGLTLWYDNDINLALSFLTNNPEKKKIMLDEITSMYSDVVDFCNDEGALKNVINKGDVRVFHNYDSAVKETFVDIFIRLFLN